MYVKRFSWKVKLFGKILRFSSIEEFFLVCYFCVDLSFICIFQFFLLDDIKEVKNIDLKEDEDDF